MVREESSPGSGSPRSAASFVWLLPAALIAVATGVSVAVMEASARVPVAVAGGVSALVLAALGSEVARRGRVVGELRGIVADRDAALARRHAEADHLAGTLLPDAVRRLRQGEFPEDILGSLAAPEEHRAVVRVVVDAVAAEEDLRESAQRAFVNIARRVQAIVHQQAQELRAMEDRHGHRPEVFGDLLRIDHGTALIGRLADSIAVLGGARPGRQWSRAVPLYSVLRGAMSRIIDYQRVELHSVTEVAVTGPAVEPLIHALAELLDNATRYSPPQTKVHLTAVDVQSGIAVEIEDGGVSMSEEARKRAERMLRQAQQGIDLNDLGETPRLGLAVVGRLAQAYGFQVSLRSSAYGGVRAVVVVPQELITTVAAASGLAHGIGASSVPRAAVPAASPAAAPAPVEHAAVPEANGEAPPVVARTVNGLPQRRRRKPLAEPPRAAATGPAASSGQASPAPATPAPGQEPSPQVQPGMWLAAFQSGLSGEPNDASKGNSQQ
ncbi:sensor histidine kinase [Streptomyces sudanensis]|uniref:sensor histidine kinase n=1 Tax=Streptomyces sudanensis TaxID=436397 RepID=UPI0020CDC0E5|nr:ATP-binding protein [Streptomyces sudanensis]MCP9960013.1 ATP-binding protein [Streptomyces sudanensis]MCP9999584.1 ATP-binding protein [Streptomyces sudanensis]